MSEQPAGHGTGPDGQPGHLGARLSALVDGELSLAERDRVLAHVAGCEPCRAEAAALRALKQRMHALSEAAADTDLVHRLLAMTPPAGPAAAPRPRRHLRAALAAVGASSALAAGLAAAAFLAGGGEPVPEPTITPAVDVFMIQHAITAGTVPHVPAPQGGPAPAKAPATATPATAPTAPSPAATASPASRGLVFAPASGRAWYRRVVP